jgi:CMP-N-acetylneuraminic acid synthetase
MIAYSVVAGQMSDKIDICIVSTDSQEIANIAKEYGADVPFFKSK